MRARARPPQETARYYTTVWVTFRDEQQLNFNVKSRTMKTTLKKRLKQIFSCAHYVL